MKITKYFLTLCIILILYSVSVNSAVKTWTGSVSTDWSDGANWGGTAPALNDNVNIPTVVSGIYPIISTNVSIDTGTISVNSNNGTGASLTIVSGGSLSITGLLSVKANGIFSMTGGTASLIGITSSGSINIQSGTITSAGNITINTGTFSQSGGLIHLASSILVNPTNNLVINGGIVTQSSGTFYSKDFAPSTGTFNQTGASAVFRIFHDWRPTFGHTFNSTAGTVRFSGTSSASATFVSTNTKFNNINVDTAINPGFSNNISSLIKISGDLTNINSGLVNSSNATFILSGSGNQNITSSSESFFGNLTVNKISGVINLLSNLSVTNTLNMTLGNINTGSNILTLGTSTSSRGTFLYTSGIIVTGSAGGFRRWFINATVSNRVFPVGTVSSNNSITLSFTVAPTNGGTLTARFIPLDPGSFSPVPINDAGYSVDSYSSTGYWQIDTGDGISNDGTYNLSLNSQGFNPTGNEITNYQHLRILKREGSNLVWIADGTHINATGSNANPIMQRVGLQGFSQFGMGGNITDGNPLQGPLPVNLILFISSVTANNVELKWQTESEKNNKGFEIYRKNTKTDWQRIGFVKGSGNSNTQSNYVFFDNDLNSDTYNYRLKQIDYNGNFNYYFLNNNVIIGIPLKIELKQNYPNPFNPVTKINYSIPTNSFVSLKVYDVIGKLITTLVNSQTSPGNYTVEFNAQNFSSGIYFYRLIAGNSILTKKMLLIK